jgi:hypothetical protein
VDVSVPELPLQIAIELGKLTVGTGLTVTVDELGKLGQPFNVYTTE